MAISKQNKNILYILSGISLEYFDVMVYVHLAAAVSAALFFTDVPFMAKAGFAFSFLSTVALRPIGALIWGHLGDKYGRKMCVTVTPIIVGCSCTIMIFLPTYRDIGVYSIFIFFLIRAIQGLAWTGEKTAANVYITEIVEFKKAGFFSSLAGAAEDVGGVTALGLISLSLFLDPENGWKYPFIIGGLVAFASIPFRRNLEESRDFLEAKRTQKEFNEILYSSMEVFKQYSHILKKFIIIEMLFGMGFFFVYIYCGEVLSKQCQLTAARVASHNMIVGFIQMSFIIGYGLMSLKWDGLKIVRYRVLVYISAIPFIFWYFLTGEMTEFKVYVTQILICLLGMDHIPCLPHLMKVLPVLVRMRGFAFALSLGKALMYGATTFGLTYVVQQVGNFCIPLFFMFIAISVAWAIWTYPQFKSV